MQIENVRLHIFRFRINGLKKKNMQSQEPLRSPFIHIYILYSRRLVLSYFIGKIFLIRFVVLLIMFIKEEIHIAIKKTKFPVGFRYIERF